MLLQTLGPGMTLLTAALIQQTIMFGQMSLTLVHGVYLEALLQQQPLQVAAAVAAELLFMD